MSDIFDWDDEDEKKEADDKVWGAYPLAQPAKLPALPPPEQPTTPVAPEPHAEPETWNEIETVIRPRPEPASIFSAYEPRKPEKQPDEWVGYPGDNFESAAAPEPNVWSEYPADTPQETARKGGLAWTAGIVFFSSVAFMLLLGWIADWLFESSPWGLIGGIVLGSIMGFVQFFRISSRIFNPKKTETAERPLMTRDE
jgi:F0F1-type ATP synthase assembly protein I